MTNAKGILNYGPWVVEAIVDEVWELKLYMKQDDGTEDVMSLSVDMDTMVATLSMPNGVTLSATLS